MSENDATPHVEARAGLASGSGTVPSGAPEPEPEPENGNDEPGGEG
jgi:hypothetical protein